MASSARRNNTPVPPVKRSFSFDPKNFKVGVEVPVVESARQSAANVLPFKQMYSDLAVTALQNKPSEYFVTQAYFTDERGITFDDKKEGAKAYIGGKLRDQFRVWQKEAGFEAIRAKLGLTIVWRDGTKAEHIVDPAYGKPEPHMALWVFLKK